MPKCPQCGDQSQPDPENGWLFCFRCGHCFAPRRQPVCRDLEPWRSRAALRRTRGD